MATKKIIKADNWDGKSRPSNKAYDEAWHRIFGKKDILNPEYMSRLEAAE